MAKKDKTTTKKKTNDNKLSNNTDYDKGTLTSREKTAGENQTNLAKYSDNTLKDVADWNQQSARNIADWNSNYQYGTAQKSAGQTREVAEKNAANTFTQLQNNLGTYDMADQQNASLRDTQNKQASRKSEAERFEAQRNLQNAALGLFGSMNQAMNGSTVGNVMHMLSSRNDAENSTYWQQLLDNWNSIQNAYDESANQNQIARRDAAINALKALQDEQTGLSGDLGTIQSNLLTSLGNIQGDLMTNLSNIQGDLYANRRNLKADTAANLNNINPNLYKNPKDIMVPADGYQPTENYLGSATELTGGAHLVGPAVDIYQSPGSNSVISGYEQQAQQAMNNVQPNRSQLLDYLTPANSGQSVRQLRNRLNKNDYFSRLINGYNNR